MKKIFAVLFLSFLVVLGYESNTLAGQSYTCTGTVRCEKGSEFVYCGYSNWLVSSASSSDQAMKEVYKDCASARGTSSDKCKAYGSDPLLCSTQNASM